MGQTCSFCSTEYHSIKRGEKEIPLAPPPIKNLINVHKHHINRNQLSEILTKRKAIEKSINKIIQENQLCNSITNDETKSDTFALSDPETDYTECLPRIRKLQRRMKQFLNRKRYLRNKSKLQEEQNEFIKNFVLANPPSQKVILAESKHPKLNKMPINAKLLVDYCNNSYYIGETNLFGCKCGYGCLVHINGSKFEGFWTNGVLNGKGRHIEKNGDFFEGNFVSGEKKGKGTMIWSNGKKYVGEFKNSKPHGRGKFYLDNNENYEVTFNNGKITRSVNMN